MQSMDWRIIDTRDLVTELEELEAEDDQLDSLSAEDLERRDSIRALFEEISGYSGDRPEDGIALIAEGHFTDYAQELAEDIGAIDSNASWPLYHIDWAAAAEDLKQDYTSVEFDGVTYWYR